MTNRYQNFHVQAFFLHNRLLSQYNTTDNIKQIAETTVGASDDLDYGHLLYECFVAQIYAMRPPELSTWLLEGRSLGESALITTTQSFYFGKEGENRRYFANTLAANRAVSLRGTFSTQRCVGDTGKDLLRNQRRVTVLAHAIVTDTGTEPKVELTPLFMGVLVETDENNAPTFMIENRREVYAAQLEEFAKVADRARASSHALRVVAKMPEKKIKESFAEILGQPFIDNDWGGETSDLSATVTLDGVRKEAAFAFKGPGIQGKFTVSKMGKNGDQGIRLFHESIDLAVIQYHGAITAEVRSLMSDLARSRNKRFMILDGSQTASILDAYGFIPPKDSAQSLKV